MNLRYKFPLVGGCLGGALAGAYVYFAKLAALGFGTTAVPGIAIADPSNNGYLNYLIAHLIALGCGFGFTLVIGRMKSNKQKINAETVSGVKETEVISGKEEPSSETKADAGTLEVKSPMSGTVKDISESSDPTFAAGVLGRGIMIDGGDGKVYAPADGEVQFVFDTKHAVGLRLSDGTEAIIHCGIDTVNLKGEGFEVAVSEGQKVKQGDLLLTFSPEVLKSHGFSSQTVMAFTKLEEGREVSVYPEESAGIHTTVAKIG